MLRKQEVIGQAEASAWEPCNATHRVIQGIDRMQRAKQVVEAIKIKLGVRAYGVAVSELWADSLMNRH